jgi:hypothetical protein
MVRVWQWPGPDAEWLAGGLLIGSWPTNLETGHELRGLGYQT